MSALRYVPEHETAAVITHELALDAARKAFTATVDSAALGSLVAHGSDPQNRFTVKPAASAEDAGVKIGTYWPGNDEHGLPRHHSTLLIFDQHVGRIGAVLEVGAANAYRTAAADALAVDLLARPDARTVAVFGTGHQAGYDVRAVVRVRPIEQVLVVGRDPDRAGKFADSLAGEGIPARTATAGEGAAADIVITATTAGSALFDAGRVRPGAHISAMGADGPGKRELPAELLTRARLFCDLTAQSRQFGELQHAPDDVPLTQLGDVLTGRAPGRRSPEDITVFDSSGIGLQDLYLGLALLDRLDAA
ncbi:ornithine cyclodeaminase family protein [Amycolatopsis jejuensis]|uniref:ornithine cyclodeaminase family protein n=1 Tax=Amycolatopsis jejuensis TaxID=330084 RepID=UPI0009FC91FD|nr:ornithine cyclodeaminase family protein [Amycolatopsis jejuensis]